MEEQKTVLVDTPHYESFAEMMAVFAEKDRRYGKKTPSEAKVENGIAAVVRTWEYFIFFSHLKKIRIPILGSASCLLCKQFYHSDSYFWNLISVLSASS